MRTLALFRLERTFNVNIERLGEHRRMPDKVLETGDSNLGLLAMLIYLRGCHFPDLYYFIIQAAADHLDGDKST